MDILAPELIDLARERGSGFVAVAAGGELVEFPWDSTDARWEDILGALDEIVQSEPVLYVGVVTEGMSVDTQTYELNEHLTVTVVHPAGYTVYKVPMAGFNALVDTDPLTTIDSTIDELEFDFPALWSILGW